MKTKLLLIFCSLLIALLAGIGITIADEGDPNWNPGLGTDPNYGYTPPDTEAEWVELIEERSRNIKVFQNLNRLDHYSIDSYVNSIHYQENPDNPGDPWLEIESILVPSDKPNWDWEMERSHWNLLVKNDGTIAAKKGSSWIGFRLHGIAYLEITSKDYTILRTSNVVVPEVSGNVAVWSNFIDGVDYVLYCGNDGLKEDIIITQAARDWCIANPPSSYGYSNMDTYLVMVFECDWSQSFAAELPDGTIINLDLYEGEDAIHFRDPIKNKIITNLPAGDAFAVVEPETRITMRRRLINNFGSNWLLSGARVVDLNNLASGPIVFDPTIDEQVGASDCDAHEYESGYFTTSIANAVLTSHTTASSRKHNGVRFTGLTNLDGATISVAYLEAYCEYTAADDPNCEIYADDLDNSPVFSSSNKILSGRTNSSTSDSWVATSTGTGWVQSSTIVNVLQEQSDDGHLASGILTLLLIANGDAIYEFNMRQYDYSGNAHGAKLHVEYSTGVTYQPRQGAAAMPGSPIF